MSSKPRKDSKTEGRSIYILAAVYAGVALLYALHMSMDWASHTGAMVTSADPIELHPKALPAIHLGKIAHLS